jgi:hypothetical protein
MAGYLWIKKLLKNNFLPLALYQGTGFILGAAGWNGQINNKPNGQKGQCKCGNHPLL